MAYIADDYVLTGTFVDSDNTKSTAALKLEDTETEADAVAFTTAYGPVLQAVSECAPYKLQLSKILKDTTLTPNVDSDVCQKAVFHVEDSFGQVQIITIPGVLESILNSDGKTINMGNAAVIALIDAWTTGLGGVRPILGNGRQIVQVLEAYKQHQRSHLSKRRRMG